MVNFRSKSASPCRSTKRSDSSKRFQSPIRKAFNVRTKTKKLNS